MRNWPTAPGFPVRAVVLVCAVAANATLLDVHAADTPSAGVLRAIRYHDKTYYYRLVAADASEPAPVVVLLHGAGDHPENMIEAWKGLARVKGITLVAPALPMDPKFVCIDDHSRLSYVQGVGLPPLLLVLSKARSRPAALASLLQFPSPALITLR